MASPRWDSSADFYSLELDSDGIKNRLYDGFSMIAGRSDLKQRLKEKRWMLAIERNTKQKEKRNKEKLLALSSYSVETGSTGFNIANRLLHVQQIVKSSDDPTNDSHDFPRAVEALNAYRGRAFTTVENIEDQIGLLPAIRRIVFDLGGLPWEDFANSIEVPLAQVRCTKGLMLDEVVCANILLRWIRNRRGHNTATELMKAIKQLDEKQIQEIYNQLKMEEQTDTTLQSPAHSVVSEDDADHALQVKFSRMEKNFKQSLVDGSGKEKEDMMAMFSMICKIGKDVSRMDKNIKCLAIERETFQDQNMLFPNTNQVVHSERSSLSLPDDHHNQTYYTTADETRDNRQPRLPPRERLEVYRHTEQLDSAPEPDWRRNDRPYQRQPPSRHQLSNDTLSAVQGNTTPISHPRLDSPEHQTPDVTSTDHFDIRRRYSPDGTRRDRDRSHQTIRKYHSVSTADASNTNRQQHSTGARLANEVNRHRSFSSTHSSPDSRTSSRHPSQASSGNSEFVLPGRDAIQSSGIVREITRLYEQQVAKGQINEQTD